MDFKRNRRRNRPSFEVRGDLDGHVLQMYRLPPTNDLSLEEFEEYAVERLKVLRTIETTALKHPKQSDEYFQTLQNEFKKQGLTHYLWRNKSSDNGDLLNTDTLKARVRDHTSHFILRLAYCKTEALRKWFIAQEVDLFKFRFQRESWQSQQQFIEQNCFKYDPITEDEKQRYRQDIIDSTYSTRSIQCKIEDQDFKIYKVHFTEVIDLIASRKVFVRNGYAYIPQPDLISVLINTFKTELSHALTVTMRVLPSLEEDERLLPLVNGLCNRYVGKDYTNQEASLEITPEMVDDLSKQSFPLCMRILHETLRKEHHLKHGSRLQYSLFLKGIGMTLQSVLHMWKSEFTKIMDCDKFDKQYAYGLRHSFGKEGKRVNYTPYNCSKILTTNTPAAGDTHGCPFKHCNKNILENRLKGYNMNEADINKIMGHVSQGNYQMACSQYFESSHKSSDVEMFVSHPNQYFTESQNILTGKKSNDPKAKVKTVRSVVYSKKNESKTDDSLFNDEDFMDIVDQMESEAIDK